MGLEDNGELGLFLEQLLLEFGVEVELGLVELLQGPREARRGPRERALERADGLGERGRITHRLALEQRRAQRARPVRSRAQLGDAREEIGFVRLTRQSATVRTQLGQQIISSVGTSPQIGQVPSSALVTILTIRTSPASEEPVQGVSPRGREGVAAV